MRGIYFRVKRVKIIIIYVFNVDIYCIRYICRYVCWFIYRYRCIFINFLGLRLILIDMVDL